MKIKSNARWSAILLLLLIVFIILPIVLNMFGYKMTENFEDISGIKLGGAAGTPPTAVFNMENANKLQNMLNEQKNEVENSILNMPTNENFSLFSDLSDNLLNMNNFNF